MLTLMMPSGPGSTKLSNFHMLGGGKKFLEYLMKKKNIQSLSQCITMAQDVGVKMIACQMTMDLMGIKPEELLDGVEFGGAATCIGNATRSKINFFI
jgi:peroxiredoxin family protein